jgi:hypothetical protein
MNGWQAALQPSSRTLLRLNHLLLKLFRKIMNKKLLKITSLAFLMTALPLVTACSSTATSTQSAEPAAIAVATTEGTATVKAISHRDRTITLVGPKGKRATYKVGPEAVNFDQIRVGDRVNFRATEALAVYLRPQGTPRSVGEGAAVALAPKGAMPGGIIANTVEVTARVVSVDSATRHVTLQLPTGRERTVSVSPRVDLTKVAPGDTVTAQVVDALAISVEKP